MWYASQHTSFSLLGRVIGNLAEGFTAPKRTSASALPASWPEKYNRYFTMETPCYRFHKCLKHKAIAKDIIHNTTRTLTHNTLKENQHTQTSTVPGNQLIKTAGTAPAHGNRTAPGVTTETMVFLLALSTAVTRSSWDPSRDKLARSLPENG